MKETKRAVDNLLEHTRRREKDQVPASVADMFIQGRV
jgi:hypothetical protein